MELRFKWKEVQSMSEKTQIRVQTEIDVETHEKISQLCRDRKVSLKYFLEAVLTWAGEQSGEKLVKLGVNLPKWLDDTKGSS
jgi:hypothetical protein